VAPTRLGTPPGSSGKGRWTPGNAPAGFAGGTETTTAFGAVTCPGGGVARWMGATTWSLPAWRAKIAVPATAPTSSSVARKRSIPLMIYRPDADNITRMRYRQKGGKA
jgi:hypothetical protein